MISNKEIEKTYNNIYLELSKFYNLGKKPYLKIYNLNSGSSGVYINRGYKYSNYKSVIKINLFYNSDNIFELTKTLIHEFCHHYINLTFPDNKNPHSKLFWNTLIDFNIYYFKK